MKPEGQVDPLGESEDQKFWDNFKAYVEHVPPFLKEYAQWWRKAFNNPALLLVNGMVVWLVLVNIGPDPKTWPWWIYPLGLVLVLTAVLNLRFLLICLFRIIRFLPTYFRSKSWKRIIMATYRDRTAFKLTEMERSLMESVTKDMEETNPETLKFLRERGFL
jgi:hypothetical protein